MTSLLETHGAVITLDFLPVWQGLDTLKGFHSLQGQSMDYAIQHGGYAVEEREDQLRGMMAYLKIKNRGGYGINGWIVRSVENMQEVSLCEGSRFPNDGYFTEEIAAPQLSAIRASLNYTEGHLANINGALDSWVCRVAERFGLNPDNI